MSQFANQLHLDLDSDDIGMSVVPARIMRLDVRQDGLLAPVEGMAIPEGDDIFIFTPEISNNNLDSYFTHMADSTLRNFARDAAAGVSFQDSHDTRKLGLGYSLNGKYEEEGDRKRTLADFYTVPGIRFGGRHSFQATDDFIRAVQTRLVRDVSVGFYGGKWVCDICGLNYFAYGDCPHWAGFEYEVIDEDGRSGTILCTVTIHDARLSEVSAVFDGATPGAVIIKANREAAAGRLDYRLAQQIERRWKVQLPDPKRSFAIETGLAREAALPPEVEEAVTRQLNGSAEPSPPPADAPSGEPVESPGARSNPMEQQNQPSTENTQAAELEAQLAAVRAAVAETPAPDSTPAEAVRWLAAQVAELQQQNAAAQAELDELRPLAEQGRAYRAALIDQAVAEGVRAQGEAFPEAAFRATLETATIEHIQAMRDSFAASGDARLPGGPQVKRDKDDETAGTPDQQRTTPVIPPMAYAT